MVVIHFFMMALCALLSMGACDTTSKTPLDLADSSHHAIQSHVDFDRVSLLAREESIIATFPKSSNALAFKLFHELLQPKRSLVFSPLSVSSALAMTFAGAKNATEAELKAVAHFGSNDRAFHQAFGDFMVLLATKDRKKTTVEIANILWAQNDLAMVDNFSETLTSAYKARPVQVDFAGNTLEATQRINQTIATITHKEIPELLKVPVAENTRLVLTNAIHFDAAWQFPFSQESTLHDFFTLSNGETKQVPFMVKTTLLPYGEDDEKQFVLLPYDDNEFAALLVLPKEDDLSTFEENYNESQFTDMLNQLTQKNVHVQVPKFSERTTPEIKNALKALGIHDAFDSARADFSGIVNGEHLAIDDVIHEAVVKFHERGTTASAATAVVMIKHTGRPAKPMRSKKFFADRPFLFHIIHKQSKTILFMGRINDPQV